MHHLEPGDHLRIHRGHYFHHALYEGDGWVLHYTFQNGPKKLAHVRRDPLGALVGTGRIEVIEYASRLPRDETVRRARTRVGEVAYHLFQNNCEHFCRWACTGENRSEQIERIRASAEGAAATTALAKASTSVVAAGGAVANRSAAGLMSGMASLGRGPAFGLAVLSTMPAAASVGAVHRVLKDDPRLGARERRARRDARGVASGTAAAGPLVVRGVVHMLGRGAGAARLASGLRALGTLAGGGMGTGIAVAIVLPAAITFGLAWLFYRSRR
jgi:hypothetical protein